MRRRLVAHLQDHLHMQTLQVTLSLISLWDARPASGLGQHFIHQLRLLHLPRFSLHLHSSVRMLKPAMLTP